MKNILKILLAVLAIMTLSVSAFAQNMDAPNPGNPPPPGMQGQPPNLDNAIKSTLGSLVMDNTLSREQAITALQYFNKEFAATKKLSPPDREKYMSKNKEEKNDPLNLLIKDGVITPAQADAIQKALMEQMPPPGGPGGPGGGETLNIKTTATYNFNTKANKTSMTIKASKKDESGVKTTAGGVLTLSNSTITTTGDSSSMDGSSFYGLNAAVLAEAASTIDLTNCTIRTSGTGANGVFASGSGAQIQLKDVTIYCTADGAHGVDATLKGTLSLTNVDITTAGAHGAAIATDRGEGTITVSGGTHHTSGAASPGIYSTGDIKISGANITATDSEAAVIEGKNSIVLTDTTLYGGKLCGAMLYQSFSGDADVGTSKFIMTDGSLTAAEGPLFYVTNTNAVIELTATKLNASSSQLLKASAGRWGTSGTNGATVTFIANNQDLVGNIDCDNISAVNLTLANNTSLKGSVNNANGGTVNLALDNTSTWNVTGTSYLTSLTDENQLLTNIKDNGFTIYYDANAAANSWLEKKTYCLTDGGKLTPKQ